jgi:hypothetical protein
VFWLCLALRVASHRRNVRACFCFFVLALS